MKKACVVILLLCNVCTAIAGHDWKPVEGSLLTQWGKSINPECPLPEYPRPIMERSEWMNLNGLWNYEVTPADNSVCPEFSSKQILVPFAIESALSGVKQRFEPTDKLWYNRTFNVPAGWKGKNILLHFGAVDYKCIVYVNGKKVGEHEGSSDAFSFDITNVLKKSGEQILTVEVTDPTNEGRQPRGKQVLEPKGIYYTAVSGIWKTVWLEPVAKKYIVNHKGVADIEKGTYTVFVKPNTPLNREKVRVTASVAGKQISQLTVESTEAAVLKLDDVRLWSPDSPSLYDLKIELLDGNKVIDQYTSYFGMRKVSIEKDKDGINRIFLNGKPFFQYGLLDQGWWPDGLLTAPSDEALLYDIQFTKDAGFNTIRKHIKIENDRFYYHCDRIGLLVWQDAVTGDKFNLSNVPDDHRKEPEAAKQFESELENMIDQLYNYPCITQWVVFNEGWGQYGEDTMLEWTKKKDPTRLATISGWVDFPSSDVADVHRYPGPGRIEETGGRPFVVGEFGGLGLPVQGHLWNPDMRNWGYANMEADEEFRSEYANLIWQLRMLVKQGLSGAIYTQTTDVEGEVNGLVTYDREVVKIPVTELNQLHTSLYSSSFELKDVLPNSEKVAQVWKYTFNEPEEDWYINDFNDGNWQEGKGLFGTNNPKWQFGYPVQERTAFAHLPKTEWKKPNLWMRRDFVINEIPAVPVLAIQYDDDVEVYLNGTLVASVKGRPSNYNHFTYIALTDAQKQLLVKGRNVIAVKATNNMKTRGNQSVDVGIVDIKEIKY